MPILLTQPDKIPADVAAYLNDVQPEIEQTYIIGGTGVISTTVENSLTNALRIGGEDRYDTNKLVIGTFSLTFSAEKDVIYLANGNNKHLVDALTGAMLAAKSSTAIVLTSNPMQDNTWNFLKDMFPLEGIVAFGGDSLIAQQDLDELVSYVNYKENGATIGAATSSYPFNASDNMQVSGDQAVLQNTNLPHNLYVTGSNVTLKNLIIEGALILEPTSDGTVYLEHVLAKTIIINTGAVGNIQMKYVQADIFLNQNKTPMNITMEGNTTFQASVIMADASLDTGTSGTFGELIILSVPKTGGTAPSLSVQLAGIYREPILLSSQATVTATTGTTISAILIATNDKNNTVTLEGQFTEVHVFTETIIEILDGSVINHVTIYEDTGIKVNQNATVEEITKENNAVLTLT